VVSESEQTVGYPHAREKMKNRVMRAWLRCDNIKAGRFKNDKEVTVNGADGDEVSHQVPKDRIHPRKSAVLVSVFRDSKGFWVRFPTNAPYKPFRVTREQLRKA